MGELRQHQPSMSIDEQVENLKSIGLIINDEEYQDNTDRIAVERE